MGLGTPLGSRQTGVEEKEGGGLGEGSKGTGGRRLLGQALPDTD